MYKTVRIITIFLLLLTTACRGQGPEAPREMEGNGGGGESKPAYGDVLRAGSLGDAVNLLPMMASDTVSLRMVRLIYNGLVRYDKNLDIVGDLAEGWDISEDGTVITFHLRKGVRWHDGRPFTARDALFTYQLMVDPATPTPYAGDFLLVKEARAVDDYTFRVSYEKPFAPALISWSMGVAPRHLLEGRDLITSPLARRPVGTGPFRFVRWESGREIVLRANPDYFAGRPFISEYHLRIIPDTASMFLELQAGNLDWMELTPLQYTFQARGGDFESRYVKYRYPSFSYTYLGYNLRHPLFGDRRVRQALSHAIDQQSLVEGVLLGLGEVATGPFKPDSWVYNPHVRRYPHDPDKARKLLRAAGWEERNGRLEKDGRPFSFTILTNQGNELRINAATIIQANLREVGIQVNIRVLEWAAFLHNFVRTRNFEAVILGWSVPHDPDLFNVWHSSQTGEGEHNYVSYANPEVDRLLEAARHEPNRDRRRRYYFRMQEILAEDQPYTFLFVPDALHVVSSRFRGVEPAPAGISYNLPEWFVPRSLQRYAAAE